MGKEQDEGPTAEPTAEAGKSDEDRIPGEENSPYWVEQDPFVARRQAARPLQETEKAPTPPAVAPPKETKATPAPKETQATPNDAATRPVAGTVENAPAAQRNPPPTEAKVSVDPGLAREAATAPAATPSAPAATPPREASDNPKAAAPASATDATKPPTSAAKPATSAAPPRRGVPFSDDNFERPRGWRLFRLPLWAWVLGILLSLTILLLVIDLRNKDRYRLRCVSSHLQAQRAKRFPWPFGYETLGGALRPVVVPPETDCVTQHFRSAGEVESAFLSFVLEQVRSAITNPASRNLKETRTQLAQALQLTRREAHSDRRAETRRLLADLSYREGRAGLARVEMNLREALALLQQAQKLGGDRYEDLDDWIAHLERLLRSVAPSPATPPLSTPRLRKESPPRQPFPSTSPQRRPPSRPPARPTPPDVAPNPYPPTMPPPSAAPPSPSDAGLPGPDGGASSGSGILM